MRPEMPEHAQLLLDGSREMVSGLLDGIEDVEYNGFGVANASTIFAAHNTFLFETTILQN